MRSSTAYQKLAESGFLHLPSVSTLKSYSNFTESVPGVNSEILRIVIKEFNLPNSPPYQRNMCLAWDEIKVKSGLVITKGSGRVVGFTLLNHISEREPSRLSNLDTKESEPELATHILVFMGHRLLAHVNISFIWYPYVGVGAEQLWGVVWLATRTLQFIGLHVRAWVCDGATPNHRFFQVHEATGGQYEGVTLKIATALASTFFSSVMFHILELKTAGNNLENSHGNLNSKTPVRNGMSISWSHIVSTVEEDKSHSLTRLPRIKEEHIHLSPQLRMRVKLAAQVLSTSMANALQMRDIPAMQETATFCRMLGQMI